MVWGGACCVVAVAGGGAAAAAYWFVRSQRPAAAALTPDEAIDVALMESLAQMMVDAEAAEPSSPRAAIARSCMSLAAKNQREALLLRVAEWEAAGGKPREPKGFNDMKRALR